MAGVDHQPLEIRLINQGFQQFLPDALVAPTAETALHRVPTPIIRRQVPPWRTRTQYPEYPVDKLPGISRIPAPRPLVPNGVWFNQRPRFVCDVMPVV